MSEETNIDESPESEPTTIQKVVGYTAAATIIIVGTKQVVRRLKVRKARKDQETADKAVEAYAANA